MLRLDIAVIDVDIDIALNVLEHTPLDIPSITQMIDNQIEQDTPI